MAEENIYYIEKPDDTNISVDSDVVWQDAYTEVVAYEENVENNMNITYVTEDTTVNEHYQTAIDDQTQYYSVIESAPGHDTVITNNESDLESHQSQSDLALTDNVKNLTIVQYAPDAGSILPDQITEASEPNQELEQTITEDFLSESLPTENVPSSNITTEDDDQVILYKVEDSNELFAVQIARDADGNVQKYQYKVRQNEDGQLEAVPGTIQLQPEGTDQFIFEEPSNSEMADDKKSTSSDDSKEVKIASEEVDLKYEESNELELTPEEPAVEKTTVDDNNQAECKKEDESNYYNQEELENIQEEFTEVNYIQEEYKEQEQQYESVEERISQLNEQVTTVSNETFGVKHYAEGSQVQVLSDVILQSQKNDSLIVKQAVAPAVEIPKQILNKVPDNCALVNDNIELKQIPSATSNKTNKLTFLIVTQPIQKSTQIPQLQQRAPFQQNKKFRSILRPTLQQSVQKTTKTPVFKATYKQITKKVNIPQTTTSVSAPKLTVVNNVVGHKNSFLQLDNKELGKGPRQPRKQVITPVDRVGSEIIIQVPEEKDNVAVETLELDESTDNEYVDDDYEYSPNKTKPKKRGRKRGRKPNKQLSDTPSKDDVNTKKGELNEKQAEFESKKTEIVEKPLPKYETTFKKRGPGRPRLSEKKTPFIEKEIIMEQISDSKNGSSSGVRGRGRPKFIRTQKKYSNCKPVKNESKENKIENHGAPVLNTAVLNPPRRRGRPPKKYSPEIEHPRKRSFSRFNQSKTSNDDDVNKDFENKTDDACDVESKSKRFKQSEESVLNNCSIRNNLEDLMEVSEEHLATSSKQSSESLLAILESSPKETEDPENNEKEDMLTRALKDANIINEETTELNSFLAQETVSIESIVQSKTVSANNENNSDINLSVIKNNLSDSSKHENVIANHSNLLDISKDDYKTDTVSRKIELLMSDSVSENILNSDLKEKSNEDCVDSVQSDTVSNCSNLTESSLHLNLSANDSKSDINLLETESKTKVNDEEINSKPPKKPPTSELAHSETQSKDDEIQSDNTELKSSNTDSQNCNQGEFNCSECPQKFSKDSLLNLHMVEHRIPNIVSKGKFKCSQCTRLFVFEIALKFHEKSVHNRQKKSQQTNKILNKTFQCTQCSKKFHSIVLFHNHELRHKSFKCDKCSEQFLNSSQLNQHIRDHIKENLQCESKRRLRQSTVNKTEFSEIIRKIDHSSKKKKDELSANTFKQSNAKKNSTNNLTTVLVSEHRCSICSKSFRQLAHLVMHRDIHNKPKCLNCGQIFSFQHTLNEHMRKYCLKSPLVKSRQSSNNSYNCDHCKKQFKNQIFFSNHLKIHHNKKSPPPPHARKHLISNKTNSAVSKTVQSSLKRKTTCLPSLLTRKNTVDCEDNKLIVNSIRVSAPIVERRQSGRKQVPSKKVLPIRCDLCNLSFTTYTGLFRHTRFHPDITTKCKYCSAGFETKAQLQKHERNEHRDNIRFTCVTCQAEFKTNEELQKHKNEKGINSQRQRDGSAQEDNKLRNNTPDKNDKIAVLINKSINSVKKVRSCKKKLPYGGIPVPQKMKNKMLKHKLAFENLKKIK